MKCIKVFFCLLMVHSAVSGQIIMQTNLPSTVPINTELTFDVRIKKGTLTNFSKYQIEFPQGVKIQEVDSKLGTFSSEENIAKIIWVISPVEAEYSIKLKLVTGISAGSKTFVQKYFYMENDDKKEVEMEPLVCLFKDSSAAASATSTSEFRTLISKVQLPYLTTTIDRNEISTKNPEVLKQQVVQLRKDSKDAASVGENEKSKAQLRLTEANDALVKAESITNETEKKQAIAKATDDKQKAENDMEVASRVLTLAKSLEDNANEIEAINKSLHPASYTENNVASSNNSSSGNNKSSEGTFTNVDLTNIDEPGAATTETDKKVTKKGLSQKETFKIEEAAKETGLVFKIQLGAFANEPKKSDFKALGKVSVTSENGMYKVLYGSYATKEEAFKRREEVLSKGFDGFVVSYQDGVRVK